MFSFHIGWYSVDLYSTYIPILIVLVPPILVRYLLSSWQTARQPYWFGVSYLAGASVSWVASIYMPNLPIGSSDSVSTHLMGGGLVVPFLCGYLRVRYLDVQQMGDIEHTLGLFVHFRWVRFASLFAVSSIFGVVNELAEASLVMAGIMEIEAADTWSDLTANAVGTVIAFAVIEIWRVQRHR